MVKDFDAEIAAHQKEIEKLEAAKSAFEEMTYDQQLAKTLHDAFCRWNHTDGCSWYYEVHEDIDDWTAQSHAGWLRRVAELRKQLPAEYDNETITKVVRAVRNLG